MQSLTQNQKYDPELLEQVKKEYENDLKVLLDKIDRSVDNRFKDWENGKIALTQENNNLKNEIGALNHDKNRLKVDNANLHTTNQKLQVVINNLSTNKSNDNDAKIRDLQKLKDNLDNEKNILINENIQLTTENKNFKLQLQKAQNQIDTLKLDNNSLQSQNKELTQLLKDIRGEIEKQYKDQIDDLNKGINKAMKERNDKDLALLELQTKHDLLQAKCDEYNKLLKDQISKFAQKKANLSLNKNDEFHQKLQAIKEEYEHDLQIREEIWEKAKEESLKTLNDAYRTLKDGLGKQNEQLRETVQQQSLSIEDLKKELQKLKDQKKQLETEIADKDRKLHELTENDIKNKKRIEDLNNQIFALEKEISQYKIVWNHFFGLDMPLREQILIGKEKLDRFEQQHNITPRPSKKSKIEIDCLESFGRLPVRLGELPFTDGNKQPRFDLINVFNDKEISLRNCFLRNEKGDRIKLPDHFIRPSHAIGFSIGNKKILEDDMLLPTTFCMFNNENNRIMIEDACSPMHHHVLYPIPLETIRCLDKIKQCPIVMNSIKMDAKKDGWRGFELKNRGAQCILLQNMSITRENTNFKQQMPERPLNPGDTMRFVFAQTNNKNQINVHPDDILINERDFGKLDIPDKLLLVDKDGHFKILHDGCNLQNMPTNCLVM